MPVVEWHPLSPRNLGYDIVPTTSYTFLVYFITCQAFGGVGLLAVLITALAKRRKRYATWINFCVAWILSCISYLLLAFLGQQSVDKPNSRTCLVQAVLIYGAPVLTALSTLALVIQLWSAARLNDLSGVKLVGLIAVPWLVYVCILIEALIFGLHRPESIRRLGSSIYCAITTGIPGAISALIVALAMIVTIAFETVLVRTLYVSWRVFRDIDERGASISRSLMIRVAIFGLFQLTALGASIAFALQVTDIGPNGLIALMPVAAFLIFGTQRDIILSWVFWRKRRPTLMRQIQDDKSTESLMTFD